MNGTHRVITIRYVLGIKVFSDSALHNKNNIYIYISLVPLILWLTNVRVYIIQENVKRGP